ncbi:MAG: hypothetical protein K2M76_00580, partial [Muribaculaceae bacterium]|nr:hypothetical protein [Muribaculaceae bacterium]
MLRLDESVNRVYNEPVDYLWNMQTYLAGFCPGPIDMSGEAIPKKKKLWRNGKFKCDVDPTIKTGGKNFIILNFERAWSVVWRDSVGKFIFHRGVSWKSEPETCMVFDTISVIANNELILKWAFDSLEYQACDMTPIKNNEYTPFWMVMSLYDRASCQEVFSRDVYVKGYAGPDSVRFNDRIDKLTTLMCRLTLMGNGDNNVILNTNGDKVKYIRKHSVRRFKDGYSLRYMFWHKPYHPPVIRKRRFTRGQHSSQ